MTEIVGSITVRIMVVDMEVEEKIPCSIDLHCTVAGVVTEERRNLLGW